MTLPQFAVRHPAIVAITIVSLTLFGFLSVNALNSEMIPPVGLPELKIVTVYPGAGAKDCEREVSRIIENQMSTLAGVSELTSSSGDSYSVVSMSFKDGTDVHAILPRVRELLNAVSDNLPDGIQGEPVIFVAEASGFLPVFSVRIDSPMEKERLVSFLETRVSPALARIPGVSTINIVGGVKREIRITLDPDALGSRGISAVTVLEALRYGNMNFPAGTASFRSRELSFSTEGAFSNLDEIRNIVVGSGDRSMIYLKDVATVEPQLEPEKIRIRSGGKDYVVLDVMKRDEGNTIKICDETRKVLDEIKAESGGLVDWSVVTDQSETTKRSLDTVVQSAITGFILTVLVILLFLHNIRATLIVTVSIPLSILFTLIGMFLTGRSLNLLSLAGITVSIGMIVDNSIVVLENTYKHFLKTPDRSEAALKGAGEVAGAVIASTTTSVCVFAPLLFLTGIIGIVMNNLSLTIVFALGASAFVAIIVVPWLSSLFLKPEDPASMGLSGKIGRGIDHVMGRFENFYRKTLSLALANKLYAVMISVSVLAASIVMLSLLKISFIPPTDTGEFEILISTPPGFTLDMTRQKVDEIDKLISKLVPEIENTAYYVGSSSALNLTGSPNRAFGRIRLVPGDARKRLIKDIIPELQTVISETVTDCDITILNGGFDALLALGTGGQGFQMEIFGPDLDSVVSSARLIRGALDKDPDVFKTEMNVSFDSEQMFANLNRDALGALGITPYEVGLTGKVMFSGLKAGVFREKEADIPIRLTSTLEGSPLAEDTLGRMTLKTRDGRIISFAVFSELENRPAVSNIERRNRNFSVEVRGYLVTEDQSGISARMKKTMASFSLPPGVKWTTAGTSQLIGDSLSSLLLMLSISIFLVYAVMVIQFERFLQPLVIMVSIPFCLIGVVLGLYLFNSALSIIAMLAIITLGGTVVNNAIVLVDYTNMLRRDYGMDLEKAVVEGSANRLKPILMTAITTLLGVLPMALASGNGSEIYAPLGQAIFGGLLTSTVITLIVVPVLYHSLETVSARARERAFLRRPAAIKAEREETYEG